MNEWRYTYEKNVTVRTSLVYGAVTALSEELDKLVALVRVNVLVEGADVPILGG